MANHKSSLKRIKQTATKRLRNRMDKSRMRTAIKNFRLAVEEKLEAKDIKAKFVIAQSTIAKLASKGVLKKNTSARYIGRLNKLLN